MKLVNSGRWVAPTICGGDRDTSLTVAVPRPLIEMCMEAAQEKREHCDVIAVGMAA